MDLLNLPGKAQSHPRGSSRPAGKNVCRREKGGSRRGKGKERSADHNGPPLETSELIAARTGVSRMTVKRDHKFHQALNILEDAGIPRAEFTSGTRKTKRKEVVKLGEIAKEDPGKSSFCMETGGGTGGDIWGNQGSH